MTVARADQALGPSVDDPAESVLPSLPTTTSRRSSTQRPPFAKHRVSSTSVPALGQTRPPSHALPAFESSLSYTSVRDFAYPSQNPLHYGPPPEPSQPESIASTPVSESHRRLSDPSRASWASSLGWSGRPWGGDGSVGGDPASVPHDGPPYREDDDLHSPVVSSRRKRQKSTSTSTSLGGGRGRETNRSFPPGHGGQDDAGVIDAHNYDNERGYYAGTREDGSETYYVADADAAADGPGGEFITYPREQARRSVLGPYSSQSQRDSHFAITLPNRSYVDESGRGDRHGDMDERSDEVSSGADDDDDNDGDDAIESRYSRNYQFTITSPDEEMHGKAVALFDFARENENELPLVEGQVIWVSYRHGQGWLVAEDPKTQESGLVPEEYVRLLRDIQGGWGGLAEEAREESPSALSRSSANGGGNGDDTNDATTTPTLQNSNGASSSSQSSSQPSSSHHLKNTSNGSTTTTTTHQQAPVVSSFSTSSKDLDPIPPHLLGTQPGQSPPPVAHYHGGSGGQKSDSRVSLPAVESLKDEGKVRRSSSSGAAARGRAR